MSIETDQDRDDLLDEFDDVLYFENGLYDTNSTGTPMKGIFEDESYDPIRGHSEIEALKPTVMVRKSAVPNLSNKDIFNRIETDTNYNVVKPLNDGTGMVDILLKETF